MEGQVAEAAAAVLSSKCAPETLARANAFLMQVASSADGLALAMGLLCGAPPPQFVASGGKPEDLKVLAATLLRAALRTGRAGRTRGSRPAASRSSG